MGGIVIAKSNTPEFGAGGSTFNDVLVKPVILEHILTPAGSTEEGQPPWLRDKSGWLTGVIMVEVCDDLPHKVR